jgi:uncharacterized protein YktA (UPF0223 family)
VDYKRKLLEALGRIKGFEAPGESDIDELISKVERETDQTKLFAMYQTFREVVASELDEKEKAAFAYTDEEGNLQRAETLDGAREVLSRRKLSS